MVLPGTVCAVFVMAYLIQSALSISDLGLRLGEGLASEVWNVLKGRAKAGFVAAAVASVVLPLAGCGNNYRPVVSAINPVGPASQPEKLAVVISDPGSGLPGLVTVVDFS